ncbi:MAG TPA: LysR family transcriptional regulator, partial [Brevundimonas sp.]
MFAIWMDVLLSVVARRTWTASNRCDDGRWISRGLFGDVSSIYSNDQGAVLNLNDLQAFVQVVDHGGFTAAGRALGVPKSTLSKRLSDLETAIGVRLVQRTSRSFAVTEIGRDFYRHAAAMLIEAEAAENVVKGRLAEPSGTVRITASLPIAQFRLASLLPRLAASFPKVRIMLDVSDR